MLTIARKKALDSTLYDLQEQIAGIALTTHDLTALKAYDTILNVIDTAYIEKPANPMTEAYKWLLKYPSTNHVEAGVISETRKLFREAMKGK